jgi:hypothetical protein
MDVLIIRHRQRGMLGDQAVDPAQIFATQPPGRPILVVSTPLGNSGPAFLALTGAARAD